MRAFPVKWFTTAFNCQLASMDRIIVKLEGLSLSSQC